MYNLNFPVQPHFAEGRDGFASGTYWKHPQWDIWLSALHVYVQQERKRPPFIRRNVEVAEGIIDTVLYGGISPAANKPRDPIIGERCYVFGVPEQSIAVQRRIATVYHKRNTTAPDADFKVPTWIAEIDELPTPIPTFNSEAGLQYQPVTQGMSGGPVVAEDGTVLGVLVGQGSPFDRDQDGDMDQFFEFHSTAQIFDVFGPELIA